MATRDLADAMKENEEQRKAHLRREAVRLGMDSAETEHDPKNGQFTAAHGAAANHHASEAKKRFGKTNAAPHKTAMQAHMNAQFAYGSNNKGTHNPELETHKAMKASEDAGGLPDEIKEKFSTEHKARKNEAQPKAAGPFALMGAKDPMKERLKNEAKSKPDPKFEKRRADDA